MDDKKPKQKFPKNKKNKKVLVFDENARREFLTGFHKRKVQRKTKAAEELQRQLKEEKKKIKAHTKKAYEKLIRSQKPIPEVEHLLREELDMGTHSVSVTEISPESLAQKCNWIGINQIDYHQGQEVEEEKDDVINPSFTIEGMEIHPKARKIHTENTSVPKTTKDFKKAIKMEATQHLQKSKAFKIKSRKAQIKNMKRKRREERKKQSANRKGKKARSHKR